MMRNRSSTLALSLLVLLTAGCGGAASGSVQSAPAPGVGAERIPAGVAQARADSARHPYTEADIRFMTAMIGHHAQAIVIAELAPTRAASPAVRTLARRIINSQRDEIATMQQWLRDRLQPVPEVTPGGELIGAASHSAGHGAHADHSGMPGMLSDAQLRQLADASGSEFDRLFLTFMIQHHRGAIEMVEELFGSYGAGQDETVFRFASDVNVDQITEIARMQRMLVDVIFDGGTP